jgi:hypothetical protein
LGSLSGPGRISIIKFLFLQSGNPRDTTSQLRKSKYRGTGVKTGPLTSGGHYLGNGQFASMRLWTVHPRFLDPKGLVAAWREGLLAQKVLSGGTKGYRNHPQLIRFREQADPLAAIAAFLSGLSDDARRRGYHFNETKIPRLRPAALITETDGQLLLEREHLYAKLRARSPEYARRLQKNPIPEAHPLFRIVPGGVRVWEKASGEGDRAAAGPGGVRAGG